MNSTNDQLSTSPAIEPNVCCAPVLHLTLNKRWFDMIKSGIKKEEYREIKEYWVKRLLVNYRELWVLQNCPLRTPFRYKSIVFKNGYSKNAPTITVEALSIRIGKPKSEWCGAVIDFDKDNGGFDDCFIIELGRVLS